MSNAIDSQKAPDRGTPQRGLGTRLLIAVPMALILVGLAAAIFMPGFFLGGMATDSCSGGVENWFLWLYAWAVVMFIGALVPPILVGLGRRWRWVLLSLLVGAMASVTWYFLWFVILSVVC